MTFAELITELHRRSGMTITDYADAVGISKTHMSNVLNDGQPGSLKIVLACLRHAKIDVQECLELPMPDGDSETKDQRKAARIINALNAKNRALALDLLETLKVGQAAQQLRKRKQS